MASSHDTPLLPSLVLAEHTRLRLPSMPSLIEPTVDYLRTRALLSGVCQESRSAKLTVALHEGLTNAVVHGNLEIDSALKERGDDSFARALAQRSTDPAFASRHVDIQVDYDGQCCRWSITDEGKGFDVSATLARVTSEDPEVLLSSGRGILLMNSFMDQVAYQAGGRRLLLSLNRTSGEEKRLEPRTNLQQPVHVAPFRSDGSIDWEAAYQALSLNVSPNGVALLQEHLAGADRVLIGIHSGDKPIYIPAQVRHCRNLGSDLVELGCQFQMASSTPAPDAKIDLQQAINEILVEHPGDVLPGHERRTHTRIKYNETIKISDAKLEKALTCFARDLSKSGMAFISTQPLPPEVTIVFPPRGQGILRVRSRIVRCNRVMDGFFDVGAKFLSLE